MFGSSWLWMWPFCLAVLAREEHKTSSGIAERNMTKFLNELVVDYDMRLRPNFGEGSPVIVKVGLWVMSIDSINVIDMDYRLDFFIRQLWTDSRLKHSYPKALALSNTMTSKIWVPDTYFANSKSSSFHKVTSINKMITVSQDGRIHYNARITVKANCPMDLRMFPFDKQKCSLQMESYGYSAEEVIYEWENRTDRGVAVGMQTGHRLPQYMLTTTNTSTHTTLYTAGNWSGLEVHFTLVRARGYFFIHIFAPCALIVILSWISFCIPPESTAARIALGITSVLTITTLLNNINATMPKVSYIKAIDGYMIGCFLFVFCVLVEYTMVLYIINVHNKRRIKSTQATLPLNEDDYGSHKVPSARKPERFHRDPPSLSCKRNTKVQLESEYFKEKYNAFNDTHKQAKYPAYGGQGNDTEEEHLIRAPDTTPTCCGTPCWFGIIDTDCLDDCARMVFPVCFFAFNIIYWTYYLYLMEPAES